MKCIHCEVKIESNDNFCWNCGYWTVKGYSYFKNEDNIKSVMSGAVIKQDKRFSKLLVLTILLFILFTVMTVIRGNDLFKPFIYLKKQATSWVYGYKTSIMKTDRLYDEESINSLNDAYEIIKNDFDSQSWQCSSNLEIELLEADIERKHNIVNVSFCDISIKQAEKIKLVIDKMYNLFPNIKGGLTNITITNADENSEYIAYFQPLYQFVNSNQDIAKYNKVNKTQILLNSYYFLNEDITKKSVDEVVETNWYVKDVTWESTIAHELGHYITFMALLKENNLENITLETSENTKEIERIIDIFESGEFSRSIVELALQNYNTKYNTNMDLSDFALSISKYAAVKNEINEIITEETIAEAIHDYYLHGERCTNSSYEIIKVIWDML